MPNHSLQGRARRDSFLQRWFTKSELHAVAPPLLNWEFWEFPKTLLRGLYPISHCILAVNSKVSCGDAWEFLLSLVSWEFSLLANDRSDSRKETARNCVSSVQLSVGLSLLFFC